MDSLLFLGGVMAIVAIVWWEIRNDRAAPDGATTGLLAMKTEPSQAKRENSTPGRTSPSRTRLPG